MEKQPLKGKDSLVVRITTTSIVYTKSKITGALNRKSMVNITQVVLLVCCFKEDEVAVISFQKMETIKERSFESVAGNIKEVINIGC